MITTFNLYKPIGPLSYLLMSADGQRKMGIFNAIHENRLVLIFPINDKEYVINPDVKQFETLMENKATMADMMFTQGIINLTTIDGTKPSHYMAAKARLYLQKYFNDKLTEIKDVILYPNYFYIYKEYTFNVI